ncbi:MAG: hypothetical protein ACYTG0_34820, partial [Planctomycetota bacterium]
KLYDSPGDDRFVGTPQYGMMSGADFSSRAFGFRYVHAHAVRGGADVAKLYDSAGDDCFIGTPESGTMYGDTFYNRAIAFRSVGAFATAGGTDVAELYDSALADHLEAAAAWACLYDDGLGFSNRAEGFDSGTAFSTDGDDEAQIDPAALDWLVTVGWD